MHSEIESEFTDNQTAKGAHKQAMLYITNA